ncbi:unnamed protein product [Camellia sinensis]
MDLEEEYDPSYNDEDEDEITQEDAWAVISAYFEEKGLVRQQLDSFDEFIQNTMQEIVDESADIEIRPESQHNPGHQADLAEGRKLLVTVPIAASASWAEGSFVEIAYTQDSLVRTHMVWKKDKKRIRRVRCTCYFPSHCKHP